MPCTYWASVGATQLSNRHNPVCTKSYNYPVDMPIECSTTGEVVCSASTGGLITSGGGFSQVHPRPPWQEKARGMDEGSHSGGGSTGRGGRGITSPPLGWFNKSGRGYPDVSAHGSMFLITLAGKTTRESGTSASTPVVAAMCTLWNDLRLARGLPPLGFLNPLLYHTWETSPEAFNDVTFGDNRCATGHLRDTKCCPEGRGFEAVPGWDAATGLGTMDFPSFARVVLGLD
ncbi:unnamed protein product, partial [Discosporangium mesarthrocarpum]